MTIQLLSGKLHRAHITECILNYEGSLGIDLDLLASANILPYEHILVVNATNGERLETYAIPSPRGSRAFCLNGAAARRGQVGDVITVMAFRQFTPAEAASHQPTIIVLDEHNEIAERKGPCS